MNPDRGPGYNLKCSECGSQVQSTHGFAHLMSKCRVCLSMAWIDVEDNDLDGRCMHCGLSDAHKHTQKGTGQAVLPYVMADLQARANLGERRYGVPLKAFNGRSPLSDAYTE